MTYDEMNHYIKNYIENDITGRAIMLTGRWGSGKSYYIKKCLKVFLENKSGGKHKCAIVSLYGMNTTLEISKAIYTELRSIKLKKKSEVIATAGAAVSVVPKTLINALTNRIGYNIGGVSDKELQKVYDSINLNGKLVVFEDIERTRIDIIDLLGYVNNMCENDHVKMLLVANESELIEYHYESKPFKDAYNRQQNKEIKVYSEKTQNYLKAKEKSISDTLQFTADYQETIESIIDTFNNEDLDLAKSYFTKTSNYKYEPDILNYREFIVACQKACDIFQYIKIQNILVDQEFKKCIAIGLAHYLQKRIDNPDLTFRERAILDPGLTKDQFYPLIKFCFDYYHSQVLNNDQIQRAVEEYDDYITYIDKKEYNDPDLKIIYNLFNNWEKDVNKAIKNILNRLDDIKDISLNHYDRIINYLLILKYDANSTNVDIESVIGKIISNLRGRGDKFDKKRYLFTSTVKIQSKAGTKEFEKLQKAVFDALNYKPEIEEKSIEQTYEDLISELCSNRYKYQPDELIEMLLIDSAKSQLSQFSPLTLDHIRHIIWMVNHNLLSDSNRKSLNDFNNTIDNLIKEQEKNRIDCIQSLQLNMISDAIKEVIKTSDNIKESNDK